MRLFPWQCLNGHQRPSLQKDAVAGQPERTCVLVKGALEQGKGSGELLGVSVLRAGLQHAPPIIS